MPSSKCLLLIVAGLALTSAAFAQQASPPAKAEVELGGKHITIDYCRPSMRGRKVMGGLVPYGQVWRTGANEATLLTNPLDLQIGGFSLPAGKYTLFTLPSAGPWKLIINKQTGQWGLDYDQTQDLTRVDMTKTMLKSPVEQFTIEFVKKGADSADLLLEWEMTRLSVPVRVKSR
jgi:hypothetical protein